MSLSGREEKEKIGKRHVTSPAKHKKEMGCTNHVLSIREGAGQLKKSYRRLIRRIITDPKRR